MKIFVCLDDNNGMMFNHRRQSRDTKVLEDVVHTAGDMGIMMNHYSKNLFDGIECGVDLFFEDMFLDEAPEGMCCFVENEPLAPYENKIQEIIIYRWNRMYPSDMKFDINLDEWTIKETTEFPGKSHKNITKEVYIR